MANRSGVALEADMLQPVVNAKMSNVKMNLVLFTFRLNGFKGTLLACQNFCANATTIRAGYFFINRVIFLEASHTLHFGSYKTEVQLRVFRGCAPAEFSPMRLNGGWVKFGDFTKGDINCGDMFCVSFTTLANGFIEEGSGNV